MLRISLFLVAVLLVTGVAAAQSHDLQQAVLQQTNDPQQTNPSTSGAGPQQSGSQTATAPQSDSSANRRIHDSIADLLSSDPVLSDADVEVAVDDRNITLTGHVQNQSQHQRVLELTAQYSRWRKIVDKIQMK
ncbi:MAG TPA: BON domain-containing protein [Candidatus Angelobacter sp.]|jgi:osmotically-inducible protein OsmY